MELFEHHMCTKSSRGRRTTRCRTTLFLAPGQELSRVLSRGKESCQCYINQLLGTLHPEASPHPWCFVEYFLHVPPAVGLILQLLCSPIGILPKENTRKHHDWEDANECTHCIPRLSNTQYLTEGWTCRRGKIRGGSEGVTRRQSCAAHSRTLPPLPEKMRRSTPTRGGTHALGKLVPWDQAWDEHYI